jgi:SAM-dependent methyltransferase
MFGFEEVHALDYSEYEGADIIFDLNKELPDNFIGAFDYVINGGTLEHIFDVAKALENMSFMLKNGGIIMHVSPAVGWVDHGFYSVSPTLFLDYYSVNGFRIYQIEFCFYLPQVSEKSQSLKSFYSEDLRSFKAGTQLNCIKFDDAANDIKGHSGKIALFGCGVICDSLLDELYKINGEKLVNCIFDSDVKRSGTIHRMYPIFYPTAEKLLDCDYIYISSTVYGDEIEMVLLDKGVSPDCIKKLDEFI